MQRLLILIDRASDLCGSDAALARELGVSRQIISAMRTGKQAISPEMAGLLAEIAGEEITAAVLDAVLESMSKTERGQRVKAAIEKRFLAGAVAMLGILTTPAIADPTIPTPTDKRRSQSSIDKIYIVLSTARRALRSLLPVELWDGVRCSVTHTHTHTHTSLLRYYVVTLFRSALSHIPKFVSQQAPKLRAIGHQSLALQG